MGLTFVVLSKNISTTIRWAAIINCTDIQGSIWIICHEFRNYLFSSGTLIMQMTCNTVCTTN